MQDTDVYITRTALVVLLGLVVGALPCFGQAGRAELFGTIQDPAGLAVTTAKVEAEDLVRMAPYSTLSDKRGEYHIVGLPAAEYVLTIEKPGFCTYRQSGI